MKKEFENQVHLEGYVFKHSLQKRESKKDGTVFINGIVNVAVNDDATNVIPVRFIYVTEVWSKSGKVNTNFSVLEKIIESGKTWEVDGEEAPRVRIDGQIGVNDFVTAEGEMASPQEVTANFIHILNANEQFNENKRNIFSADMLISSTAERDNDNNEYLDLKGYVFGYQGRIVPVTFSATNKGGIDYFQSQDISQTNPFCTAVWGNIENLTITREETVESAWGEPQVNISSRTRRAWNVTGSAPEPAEWDDETFLTKDELKKLLSDREEHLADVRKRNDEYRATQSGKSGFPTAKAVDKDDTPPFDADPTKNEDFEF